MNYIMKILAPLWVTNFTFPGFIVVILSLLTPISPILHTVLFLIFVDNITGIMAHFKKNDHKFIFWKWSSWQQIKSKKLGSTINKSLVYMLLIICGFFLDVFIVSAGVIFIAKIFAGAVSFREVKSIIENVEIVSGSTLVESIKIFFKYGIKGGFSKLMENEKTEEVNVQIKRGWKKKMGHNHFGNGGSDESYLDEDI